MEIGFYTDNTMATLPTNFASLLSENCKEIKFHIVEQPFHLADSRLSFLRSYSELAPTVRKSFSEYDLAILATNIPYDNNFFYECYGNAALLSFHGWNQLTDLPITNGLTYFTLQLIADKLGVGAQHSNNRGCINDFLRDKIGVDVGMRAAYICGTCKALVPSPLPDLQDLERMLDLLSRASRTGKDITEILLARHEANSPQDFDLFLCHNSLDKPIIHEINAKLQMAGLTTWFDEDCLPPGRPWQAELEEVIPSIRAAAVFVGDNGIGPWQEPEVRAFLSEFIRRDCPVIPVILPSATTIPTLPIFLKAMMWIDLRNDQDQGLDRIIKDLLQMKRLQL